VPYARPVAALVLLVVLTLGSSPMSAAAAQPEIVPFSETGSGPIDCGSVVLTSFSEIAGMTTTYFDAAGAPIRLRFQETVDQTVTNPITGASISFTQSWVEQDDLLTGTRTISGRIMTGANTGTGVILQDAGRVVYDARGNVLSLNGNHEFLQAPQNAIIATSCAALA
jgi:hypothetical protein